MHKKLFLFLFCFSLYSSSVFSQKEASKWFFGKYANINFTGNTIISLTNNCSINTMEGCASMCNSNGDLLFYTDGTYVVNKNNLYMPNGTGLLGTMTSTQSALIVPDPGNSLKYYVFTAPAQAGVYAFATNTSISYSIVDMSLAGGLGDVTIKNQNLLSPACEKLTAIKHCNQIDYWVIAHEWNSDAFYSYLVTANGISPPVITSIGIVNMDYLGNGANVETIGYLKGSPNGKKIAAATNTTHKVEIFDFDNQTGQLSNPITIDFSNPIKNTYGLSFSPDNSKLYVSTVTNIYQYSLLAGSSSAIIASKYLVANSTTVMFDALQIGPDSKIYVASMRINSPNNDYLHRINNPNQSGVACDFEDEAVHLSNQTYCNVGLPNYIDGIFEEKPLMDSIISTCTFPVILDQNTRNKHYLWSTGDTTPTISIDSAGLYWVTIQLSSCAAVTLPVKVIDNSLVGYSTLKPINIFSPNNDGINDEFGFKDVIGSDYKFEVYNRWGQLVFSTTNPTSQWNGTFNSGVCAEGVYYWIVQFKREAVCNNSNVINKGFVTLVR